MAWGGPEWPESQGLIVQRLPRAPCCAHKVHAGAVALLRWKLLSAPMLSWQTRLGSQAGMLSYGACGALPLLLGALPFPLLRPFDVALQALQLQPRQQQLQGVVDLTAEDNEECQGGSSTGTPSRRGGALAVTSPGSAGRSARQEPQTQLMVSAPREAIHMYTYAYAHCLRQQRVGASGMGLPPCVNQHPRAAARL